jgi:outer membrane protein OmpA-like peptidoglycan-associated protein
MKVANHKRPLHWLLVMLLVAATVGRAQDAACIRTEHWRCRVCGYINPISARYCRRDHADLEAQRKRFREALTPVFHAESLRIVRGKSTVLRWFTQCASRVSIEPQVGQVSTIGAIRVRPTKDTVYTLKVESVWSDWMTEPAPIKVEIIPAKVELVAYSNIRHLWRGEELRLTWHTSHASQVVLGPGARELSNNGELEVTPEDSTEYHFSALAEGSEPVTVDVPVEVMPKPVPLRQSSEDYEHPFYRLALPVYFRDKEPKLELPNPELAPTEKEKLVPLVEMLRAHPVIHFSFEASATEYWDGRKGDFRRYRALIAKRWQAVHDYLIHEGVKEEQIMRPDYTGSSAGGEDGAGGNSVRARRVDFRYRGIPPQLQVLVTPKAIQPGETAYLVWASSYADELVLHPLETSLGASGMLKINASQTSLRIEASNSFGFKTVQSAFLQVNEPVSVPQLTPPEPREELADRVTPLLFAANSSEVSPETRQQLEELSTWLTQPAQQGLHLLLRGSIVNGERPVLVRDRVQAVRRILVSDGVEDRRLRIGASGANDEFVSDMPLAARRAFGRSVELTFDNELGLTPAPSSKRRNIGGVKTKSGKKKNIR